MTPTALPQLPCVPVRIIAFLEAKILSPRHFHDEPMHKLACSTLRQRCIGPYPGDVRTEIKHGARSRNAKRDFRDEHQDLRVQSTVTKAGL